MYIAGILVLFIHTNNEEKIISKKENIVKNISEGLNHVKLNKVVLSGSILFLFTNFGIHMFQSNFVYYITDILGYTSFQYGLAVSLSGVGAIIGATIAPKVIGKFKAGMIISISTMIAGLSTLLLILSSNYIYIGLILAISNMCGNINAITYFTLRQKVVPKDMLGRVVSVTRMISFMSIPLGAYIGGVLMSKTSNIIIIILVAGIIRFLAGVFGYFSPLKTSKN